MTEAAFTTRVKVLLKTRGIPFRKIWQGAMSTHGVSDIIGTMPNGRALYIELKKPDEYKPVYKGLRSLQYLFLREMKASGALCVVADNLQTVSDALDFGISSVLSERGD